MSGRKSRNKGARAEREIVARHRALGIHAERVPLSGACGGSFAGDVIIPGIGTVEVKCRAGGAGFKTIEGWLGDNAALFLRRDRQSPLIVLPWPTSSGACFAKGGRALVIDDASGEAGQDWGQSCPPWPVRHFPISRGNSTEKLVPKNPAPD